MKVNENSTVLIFGGSGFIGSYFLRRIAKSGAQIRIVGRSAVPDAKLMVSCAVGQLEFVKMPASSEQWNSLFSGATHVINLIGIIAESKRDSFHKVHVELAQQIARYCKIFDVEKFIHVSALTHKLNKSQYSVSKVAGERAVLNEFKDAIVLRPSVVFGAEDKFLNLFAKMIKTLLIVPLIGSGNTKMQPVYVDDVACAIEKCCNMDRHLVAGKIFEIAGAQQYTLQQLFKMVASSLSKRRVLVPMPFSIAMMAATIVQLLPVSMITTDQVRSLKYNSILTASNGLEYLKIEPKQLHHMLRNYMI